MMAWLGKLWKVRLALWLLVLAICFGLWPVGSALLQERQLINPHLIPRIKPNPPVGPPLVYWKGQSVFAWDWRTGHHHRLPVAGNGEGLCGVVGRAAVAESRQGEGVVVTDLEEPFAQRRYAVPTEVQGAQLLTVDETERLALLAELKEEDLVVTLVDLHEARVVQQRVSQRDFVVSSGLTFALARADRAMHISSFWTVDSASQKLEERPYNYFGEDFMMTWWIPGLGLRVPQLAGKSELRSKVVGGRSQLYSFQIESPDRRPVVLPTKTGFHAARGTTSDEQFVTLNDENSFQIWDVKTASVIAEDRIAPQRYWLRVLILAASLLVVAVTIWTMMRESSWVTFLLDATLLVVTAGSAGIASGGGWFLVVCISVAFALVGAVYIVFGCEKNWVQLFLRVLGYALCLLMLGVMFHVLMVAGYTMRVPNCIEESLASQLTLFAKVGIALPVVASLCFSLARWRGWTIGLGGNPGAKGSTQFTLRAILTMTFVIALYAAVWRWFRSISAEAGEELLRGTVSCGFFGLVGLFLLWLQMTNHRWWSVWISVVSVALTALVVYGCLISNEPWGGLSVALMPTMFSFVLFCFRLNGYRWVRIDDAHPASPRCEQPSESLTAGPG